ncbi:MAG: nucleotidyltransferase domain-containing protein [Victivallales bacterium]|nr:nucleotidyltransferase domain-containing protein [Victivallales bacterium]
MRQLDRLQQLRNEILQIARKHNAEKVYVFGSCARKEETPESDVDFVADFKEHSTLFNVVGLELDLADLLGSSVDVVTLDRLESSDAFAQSVKRDMVLL